MDREWRRRRKDAGGGRRDGRDAARHSGADEDDDIIELEENLDYPLPDSCRVIIRCQQCLVVPHTAPLPETLAPHSAPLVMPTTNAMLMTTVFLSVREGVDLPW